MENNNIEKKESTINRAETKKSELEQLTDALANDFFDDFIEKNREPIKSKDPERLKGVGADLGIEIKNLIETAKNNEGEEYADLLTKKFAACLNIYRPIVADNEKNLEVIAEAKEYILGLLAPDGKNSGLDYKL